MKNRSSFEKGADALLVLFGLTLVLACTRYAIHRWSSERAPDPARRDPAGLASVDVSHVHGRAGTYRLLLDPPALGRLSEARRQNTGAYQYVLARANEVLGAPVESGYQGFEWADAVANSALAWHATHDARFAASAVRYLRALLDDEFAVGDGKGGKDVVTHDSGYGMRTFGAYAALGYDWLRDAPGMDPALRAHVLERLGQWIDWYGKDGYLRDKPIANYYWGYLTALSFAGLAASGESDAAGRWLEKARDELDKNVLPAFRDELAGGGWPEGWQYGEYTMAEIALVCRAFETGAGLDVVRKLPWLSDTVTHHVHALLPDERTVYDGGTWGEHPAKPSALGLSGAIVALDGVDDVAVERARWMVAHALPPLRREQAWVGLLADRPGAKELSPRDGAPTSLHLAGQGLTFARSDWSKNAVFVSFQAGPPIAEDHQDADQGHFELWRGSDALLVDGGDSEGSATINHNTLLVDDGGRNLNYFPNQGVWGKSVRTTRFADDGAAVVAVGDIGEAYAPSCAEDGCRQRSVRKLVRSLVFLRPGALVIDDRVTLDDPDFGVTWAAHLTKNPTISGALASAVIGQSRVDVRTLLPEGAEHVALHEPTPSGEGSHRADHPWGPMWRLEVRSARGERTREFLHLISADRSDAAAGPAHAVSGDGVDGCTGTLQGNGFGVLFVDSERGGSVGLDKGSDQDIVVVGLTPGKHYRVAVAAGQSCRLTIAPSEDAALPSANGGGFVRVHAQCGAS